MAKNDTTIFYQEQVDICKRHFNAEQFGRLMLALFEVDEGNEPDVDEDIAIAFEFMSLQKRIDRKKYEKKCETNRKNGAKGGRPRKNKNPQKANGFFENPNDNDNENENENKNKNKNDDDTRFSDETETPHDDFLSFGSFQNVELTETEHDALVREYERTGELIEKVSLWLRSAKNPVPDHYGLCVKFATNDQWPKRRKIEPVEEITIEDPLSEEEQERRVKDMRRRLNMAIVEA